MVGDYNKENRGTLGFYLYFSKKLENTNITD